MEKPKDSDMQCHINILNDSGATISCTGTVLPWGDWDPQPPASIANGAVGSFGAHGTSGTWTGTEGWATYQCPNGQAWLTVYFNVPYSGSNSGGCTMDGTGRGDYVMMETESDYKTPASFPTGGDSVTAYFHLTLSNGVKKN